MKKTLSSFMLFFASIAFAQDVIKMDTVYYRLDTSRYAHYDNIWETGIEGNLKYYTILCPCLAFGAKPTFAYPKTDQGILLSQTSLNSKKLISLVNLIGSAKLISESKSGRTSVIFIVEQRGKNFIAHKVGIVPPRKPYTSVD